MLPSKVIYIVYKTTNKVNNKFYIGVHKCISVENFDGYFGSGTLLKKAISKYGKESFVREVLHVYETYEEAYNKEKELVTIELIESDYCYNTRLGGVGGTSQNQAIRKTMSENRKGKFTKEQNHFFEKKHSPETRKKMSDAKKGKYKGENNPNWKGGLPRTIFNNEDDRQLAQSEFMKNHNPMKTPETRKKHAESMKNKPTIVCQHCQKTMDMGGFAVHVAALKRKGILIKFLFHSNTSSSSLSSSSSERIDVLPT